MPNFSASYGLQHCVHTIIWLIFINKNFFRTRNFCTVQECTKNFMNNAIHAMVLCTLYSINAVRSSIENQYLIPIPIFKNQYLMMYMRNLFEILKDNCKLSYLLIIWCSGCQVQLLHLCTKELE